MKWSLVNINRFDCDFDYSLRSQVKTFNEELVDHVKEIIKDKKKIYLLLSGGMDSRLLGLVLLDLGIEFTAITYSFDIHFQDIDGINSKNFAKEHNIKHEIFYLDIGEMLDTVRKYNEIDFFVPILNTYYMLTAINRYYEADSIFLTGAGSEPKIVDKKIPVSYNVEKLKSMHPFVHNFTSEKILCSFANESVVKENYEKELADPFELRNTVYKKYYPNLRVIEKQMPNDRLINEYFYGPLCGHYCKKYAHLFVPDSLVWYFDLETYYKQEQV